jgi:hypothetical protein
MKKLFSIVILSFLIAFCSCNKDEIHNTDTKVGISDVTFYPIFTMSGSPYISVVQGTAYTEPGVTAKEGGTTINVTTTGSVNKDQPGLYTITYSATNKDGFVATTSRTVVVIPAHEAPGVDLSGKYDYVGSSTYTATVTKVAEGVYTTDNAWSGATTIPIVFTSVDGLTISVPLQNTPYGRASGTGTYNPTTKRLVYTLSLLDVGIDNSNRTWQRQ